MKNKIADLFLIILLSLCTIWAGKGIFRYKVFNTHDGDYHIARTFDAIKTLKEGHFPLRWAGSLNYSCGVPIYNFYYPLFYYLSTTLTFLTKNVILSLKIIYFLSILLGTTSFYLWIKTETGKKLVAFGGALIYLFAPYRFLLIFVRGNPEALAYAILPLVFLFYSNAFDPKKKNFFLNISLASFFGALLILSHNISLLLLMPIVLIYLISKVILSKISKKKIFWIFFSFILSIGLASFFIGPALVEKKYTKIGTDLNMWREHFPELWQLIRSKWGYFYSSAGTANDGMSFMLGYTQWAILAITAIFIIHSLFGLHFRIKKFFYNNFLIIIFFIISLLSIYLMLPWSIPIWEKLTILKQIQYPWRLLGVAVFTIAATFSFFLEKIKSKTFFIALIALFVTLGFYSERNHLLPQPVSKEELLIYDDFEKLHPKRYSTTTFADEVIFPTSKTACNSYTPFLRHDKGTIPFKVLERGNTYGSIEFFFPKEVKVNALKIGLSYYPGIYHFYLNGTKIPYFECEGMICIKTSLIKSEENYLEWKITQNNMHKFFNLLSLIFSISWIFLLLGWERTKKITPFLIVSGVFILFRAYNFNERLTFGWDQERDANTVSQILSGKITLLGPQVQGPSNFFLPPYFFYLLTPFYWLNKGHPSSMGLFIIFWSIVFLTSSYQIISKIFSKRIAIVFIILWAVHPLTISIDKVAWNPVVIPFFTILLLWFLSKKNLFWSALTVGMGSSFHPQFLFALPSLLPLIPKVIKKKPLKLIKILSGLFIPFLPIFIFDFRHNFLNTKIALNFFKNQPDVVRILPVWDNVVASLFLIPPNRIISITFYLLISLILLVMGRKKEIFFNLGILWILSLPSFYIVSKNPSEYYFHFLLPIPFLVISNLLNSKNLWGKLVLTLVLAFLTFKSYPLLKSVHFNLSNKERSVIFLKRITKDKKPFSISFSVPANEDAGFRYLLKYHNVNYSQDLNYSLIQFVIPPDKMPSQFTFGDIGIFIPPEWLRENWVH